MEISYGSVFLWLFWSIIVGLALKWYFSRNYDYWEKLGITSVPAANMLEVISGIFKIPIHENEAERYKKYGRFFGHYDFGTPGLTVAEPDLLRNILVKDFQYFSNRRNLSTGDPLGDNMLSIMEGEDWKRVRTIMSPTFTTGKIRRMLDIFKESSEAVCQNFRSAAQEGKSIDAKVVFGAYTIDVIASTAFSTKIDSHNDPNNPFVRAAKKVFGQKLPWRFLLFFLFPSFMKFFRMSIFSSEALQFFKKVIVQIIEERKRTGKVRNDFLQLMMDIAKETQEKEEETEKNDGIDSNYSTGENSEIILKHLKNKTLSYDEMVAQGVSFFLGGYDTTASGLSFTSYNLALHPDIQEKLIQEIDEVVKEAGGKITYDGIQNMKYLDNVISETLRLYPPAIRLERRAEEDYYLEEKGITIPKGMIVGIPAYAMQRDPEFFPDPEKFDPERFSSEEKAKRSPYTYLPFGAGPRNCIGMRFALMETKVCLAYVLSHFRIRKSSETKVPPEFFSSGLLSPKAIHLKMEIRNDKVLET